MRIRVEWEPDDNGDKPPDIVSLPQEVYDEGYTIENAVLDYLSDTFGYLVRDWRLA